MKEKQIKYKLFELDKQINKMKEADREKEKQKRLPRVYKMKPDDFNGDTIEGNNESLKDILKKVFKKNK